MADVSAGRKNIVLMFDFRPWEGLSIRYETNGDLDCFVPRSASLDFSKRFRRGRREAITTAITVNRIPVNRRFEARDLHAGLNRNRLTTTSLLPYYHA